MNEKLYRSSPAARKTFMPVPCPSLTDNKLGFKRAPKRRLRVNQPVSHFQTSLSVQLFYKFLRCIVRSVCLQNFVRSFISQSSPCIVRSVIFKSCPRPVTLLISPRSDLWEFFFNVEIIRFLISSGNSQSTSNPECSLRENVYHISH